MYTTAPHSIGHVSIINTHRPSLTFRLSSTHQKSSRSLNVYLRVFIPVSPLLRAAGERPCVQRTAMTTMLWFDDDDGGNDGGGVGGGGCGVDDNHRMREALE